MTSSSAPAPPLRARVPALVAASLVLGTAAHVGASEVDLSFGQVVVTGALLVMLVTALLGSGRRVARGRRLARGRLGAAAGHLEDAAALAALILGQALVHLSVGATTTGAAPAPGHAHHHGSAVPDGLAATATSHGSSLGMLTSHAVAALVVGLLLRWLERRVLALLALGVACTLAACGRLRVPLRAPMPPTPRRRRSVVPRPEWDLRTHLRLGLGAVVRRGPPALA